MPELRRDPIVEAVKRRHTPFTWSDLRRDRTLGTLGSEALALCAQNGWTEGLAVPIPRGDRRFGLIAVACQRRDFHAHVGDAPRAVGQPETLDRALKSRLGEPAGQKKKLVGHGPNFGDAGGHEFWLLTRMADIRSAFQQPAGTVAVVGLRADAVGRVSQMPWRRAISAPCHPSARSAMMAWLRAL